MKTEAKMKLFPICSSSGGNSIYIGSRESGVAIDVGCSFKAFRQGLSLIGADISAVKAVLVTHGHSDHVKGLLTLTKNTKIPLYATENTLSLLIRDNLVSSTAELHTAEELGKIEFDGAVTCFSTPHDCSGSCGYRIALNKYSVGFCTDLGTVTDKVRENLIGCRTVFIESNYEPEMLRMNFRYPPYLKQRIASDHGHLSNPDSAAFCGELVKSGTVNLMLGHLSRENNTPETAFNRVKDVLERLGMRYESDYTLAVAPVINTDGKYLSV